jgi:hypothetical protein
MGNVVPFKNKQQSIETLTSSLLSSIRAGKFSQVSSSSKGIIRWLETASVDDVNAFLMAIAPIVEALDWKYKATSAPNLERENAIEKIRSMPAHQILIASIDQVPELLRIRNQIYAQLFHDDRFLDKLYQLAPIKKGLNQNYGDVRLSILGKTVVSDIRSVMFVHPNIQAFLSQCFKIIISRYGLIEQLILLDLFSSFSISKVMTDVVVRNLLKQNERQSKENIGLDDALEKPAEKYLSVKLKAEELNFVDSYRLLILRHRLKMKCNDVCNALIDIVDKTAIDDIMRAFESDTDFSYDNIKEITYTPEYSQETSEFHHDLYIALNDANIINYEIAFTAFLFFVNDLSNCPLGLLMHGSIYLMDELPTGPGAAYPVEGFLAAGKIYFDKSHYEEAMLCFKIALFNIIDLFDEELSEQVNMAYFKEITRKLNSYENSINFLSKFRVISDYGFPMDQGVMNEIEITKAELEYEHETRQYHKIDTFFELVAKEDFQAIQSHISVEDNGKFVLTGDQLQILFKEIQKNSDIIRMLKAGNAKLDMLMYMNRAVYDKQAAILETVKENQEIFEEVITRNTDKIIDNIHKKNESFEKHIDLKTCQGFYRGHIGTKLWDKLEEGTRKHLLLGHHLDTTHQFSLSDEYGYIAIEYAKAIENEFKKKLVDSLLFKEPHIKFEIKKRNGLQLIDPARITLGEIAHLLEEAKKVKDCEDLLWPFVSFIENHTIGGNNIFSYKGQLFDIAIKYRNPAAHPSNYTRDTLDAFKELMFDKGFIKDYFEAIQIK